MGRSRSRSPTRHSSSRRDRSREREYESRKSRSDRYDDRDGDSDSRRKRHRSRSRDREERERQKSKRTRSRSEERKEKDKKRDRSAERAARKAEKRRAKEELGASLPTVAAELSAYDALDNPFHDANLNQQFKWHKKAEKEKKAGISVQESQRREAMRRQEAKEELDRLNKRRAEREIEQQLREEEDARMQRLAESAQMAEWISKEGDFQLEQERRRAGIRLKEKRGKAIDFLALNLKYATDDAGDADDGLGLDDIGLEIDFDEPYVIFENLSLEQTEELHDDIQKYLSLEQLQTNIDFWTNMMVVCKDRLDHLHASNANASTVESDITALLSGKSYDQLTQLQRQIQAKLSSGEPVDVEYWEGLLKRLLVWKAKAKLKSLHETVVRNRLEQLRKRQRDEAFQAQSELLAAAASRPTNYGGDIHAAAGTGADVSGPEAKEDDDVEPYERGMSPELLEFGKLPYDERQVEMIDVVDDLVQLFAKRHSITSTLFVPKASKPDAVVTEGVPVDTGAASAADLESEALYRAEAEKNMDEEEELYNLEELIVNPTTYTWEDKYRPRKPRYFNRIHTGYEWNKYNQTHYDTDNPPPKVVQGYKFNIFYPDLIDKAKAPTYKIVKEPGNEDTVLLYFTAGPPYEDIAFRVVNREWEYSHKRGFRSSFDRGCLSLWFNFRRNWDGDKTAIPQCSTLNINFSNDLITIPNPPAAPPYSVNIYRGGYAPFTLEVGNTGPRGTYPWVVNLPVNATFIVTMDDSAGYTGGTSPRCTIVPGNSNCLQTSEPMRAMSLNFTRTGNSQCGNVNIAVYNGASPFQVEIIPAFRQPKTLHFATNEFGFVLDLPSASTYALAITDAEGNSAVDGILTVGSSSDNSCLNVATTVTVGMFTSVYSGSGVMMPSTTRQQALDCAIIGVAVGGAALIAAFLLLICCIFRHHRRKNEEAAEANQQQAEGLKPETNHANPGYTTYAPQYTYNGIPEIQDSNTSYTSEPFTPSGAVTTGQSHGSHVNLPPFQYAGITTHSPQARPPIQLGSYYSVPSADQQPHRLSQDTGATTPIIGGQNSAGSSSASPPWSVDRKERVASPSTASHSGSRAYSWGMAASPPPRSFTGTVLPPYEPQSQESMQK